MKELEGQPVWAHDHPLAITYTLRFANKAHD